MALHRGWFWSFIIIIMEQERTLHFYILFHYVVPNNWVVEVYEIKSGALVAFLLKPLPFTGST